MYGQLGNGTTKDSSAPVDVIGLDEASGVTAIALAAAGNFSCAVTSAGGVKCWGYGGYSQLGDGDGNNHSLPVDVTGLTNIVALTAGTNHTCALTSSGGVKCWGAGLNSNQGQIGDGSSIVNHLHPVNVTGITSGATSIAAGDYHTCARLNNGTIKCWGWNKYGEVGDGTTYQRKTPVVVLGTDYFDTVSAAESGTCAVTNTGKAKCWGRNYYGQLGDGTTSTRSAPVDVAALPIVTVPTSPTEWAMALSIRPTFKWKPVEDAVSYELKIRKLTNNGDIDTTGTSYLYNILGLSTGDYCEEGGICSFKPHAVPHGIGVSNTDPLSFELDSGTRFDVGGYAWKVIAKDQDDNSIGDGLMGIFQIPSLGGPWNSTIQAACGGGDACPDSNIFWNRYDNDIYRYAEYWDVPPSLMKAMMLSETDRFFVPSKRHMGTFPPTRTFVYEPAKDCEASSHGYYADELAPYMQPNLPSSSQCSMYSDGRVGFPEKTSCPTPYDVPNLEKHKTVKDWVETYQYVPIGSLEAAQEYCDVETTLAQYRVMSSYGLSQKVYWYDYQLWGPEFYTTFLIPNPPPPEQLYNPSISTWLMGWTLNIKRNRIAPIAGFTLDDQIENWEEIATAYNGINPSRQYGITAVERALNITKPVSLKPLYQTILMEQTSHVVLPSSSNSSSIFKGPGQVLFADNFRNSLIPDLSIQIKNNALRILDSKMVDFKGDLGLVRVDLVILEDWYNTGWVRIYRDEAGTELLWQSKPIIDTHALAWIQTAEYNGTTILLTNWCVGAHGLFVLPFTADGNTIREIPTRDDQDHPETIFSNAGGIIQYSEGFLATFQRYEEGNAPGGSKLVQIWGYDGLVYRIVRELIYLNDGSDSTPPVTNLEILEAANGNGWRRPDVQVILSALDNREVGSISYTLSNGSTTIEETIPQESIELTLGEGIWVLTYHAKDIHSNEEVVLTETIRIDGTPPDVTHNILGEKESDGYPSDTLIELIANDPTLQDGSPGSGVDHIEYSLDGGTTWIMYSDPMSFSEGDGGAKTIQYRAVDTAGNVSDIVILDLLILGSTPAPTPTISETPTALDTPTPMDTSAPTNSETPTPQDTSTPMGTTPTDSVSPAPAETETPTPT
jgi:hypothetical protein